MRHDPQPDDPGLETDIGQCEECEGHGCDQTSPPKIVTSHIYPPIPDRSMDWCAYYDGEEERGDYGYGPTEQAAIDDLTANYERA